MSERETRDFMSVDSFSQLPFIRPAPAREKTSSSAIRLFGIEFPHEPGEDDSSSSSKDNKSSSNNGTNNTNGSSGNGGGGGGESSRKFECHYCCRNFPTSQALGGHQNAHKRERQHAKRAHLHSAMAAAHHHNHHGGVAEGHLYGLINYHRLGSSPSATRFGIGHPFDSPQPPPPQLTHFPSWNSTSGLAGPRFYTGPGSVSQPINGSPLPGFWRIPAVHSGGGLDPIHRDSSAAALPFFAGDGSRETRGLGGGASGSSSYSSSSSQSRLAYESSVAGVQDHLSLDLHL